MTLQLKSVFVLLAIVAGLSAFIVPQPVRKSAVRLEAVKDARITSGEKIFKANCSACHTLEKKLIGPALGKSIAHKKGELTTMKKEDIDKLLAYLKYVNDVSSAG